MCEGTIVFLKACKQKFENHCRGTLFGCVAFFDLWVVVFFWVLVGLFLQETEYALRGYTWVRGFVGSSASSTVKVRREEGGKARLGSEQCASPWGARSLGALEGSWDWVAQRGDAVSRSCRHPHSPQHPGPHRQE